MQLSHEAPGDPESVPWPELKSKIVKDSEELMRLHRAYFAEVGATGFRSLRKQMALFCLALFFGAFGLVKLIDASVLHFVQGSQIPDAEALLISGLCLLILAGGLFGWAHRYSLQAAKAYRSLLGELQEEWQWLKNCL